MNQSTNNQMSDADFTEIPEYKPESTVYNPDTQNFPDSQPITNNTPSPFDTPLDGGDNSPIKREESPGSRLLFVMIILFIAFVLFTSISIGSYFLLKDKFSNDESNYNADNSLDEFNEYFKESLRSYSSAINFEELNSKDPELIDVEKLKETAEQSAGKLEYLKSHEGDTTGKTVHYALDGNSSTSTSKSKTGSVLSFSFDIYTKTSESFNEVNDRYNTDPSSLSFDEVKDAMPKTFTKGNFDYSTSSLNAKGNVEITTSEFVVYIKMYDTELSGKSVTKSMKNQINLAEGKTIKLDFTKDAKKSFENNETTLEQQQSMLENPQELVNSYLNLMLMQLSDEDRAMYERIGPKIVDEIETATQNLNLFDQITDVEPIRPDSNSICSEGNLDFDNILDTYKTAMMNISEIVINDEAYTGTDTLEDANDELGEAIQQYKDQIADNNLEIKINLCSNKDEKYLTGGGFTYSTKNKTTETKMDYQFLVVSYDSDFEIKTPKADVDLTDELKKYLKDSNLPSQLLGLPSTYPPLGGLGTQSTIYNKEGEELYRVLED